MTTIDACWNRIGVRGDRSCPELERHVHCHNCPVYSTAARALLDAATPDSYIAEWTGHVASPKARVEHDTQPVLIFRVAAEWLALAMSSIVEVAGVRPIHSLPHRRTGVVLGVANIRGELLTCLSLRGLLGLEASVAPEAVQQHTAHQRLLVVRHDNLRAVCPVDEIHDIHRVSAAALAEAPATVAKATTTYSKSVLQWRGHSVGLLDDQLLFRAMQRSLA